MTLTQFTAKQKGQWRHADDAPSSVRGGRSSSRNAAAALAYVDTQQHIDVIVSDMSMPRVDGVELVRRVRERRPSLPAIALTGFYEEYMDRSTAGFAAFLRKPVNLDELCRAIRNAVRSR